MIRLDNIHQISPDLFRDGWFSVVFQSLELFAATEGKSWLELEAAGGNAQERVTGPRGSAVGE